MLKNIDKIKTVVKTIRLVHDSNCNMNIDEAMFISEYMEQHPDKKLNWALKKKLWFKYRTRRVKK